MLTQFAYKSQRKYDRRLPVVRLISSMDAGRDASELVAYLRILAGREPGSSFLELRYRVAPQTLVSKFLPAQQPAMVAAAIQGRARMTDVYVGCAPRFRRSGGKRDVCRVWVLWAECDGEASARAAQSYKPAPAIVIRSGSGPNVHAYWPLRAPLAPEDAEQANLRLAHALHADRVCYDAARILRPPGTWNHKHEPPAPVTVARLDAEVRLDVNHVLERAPEIGLERLTRRWARQVERDTQGDVLLEIEPADYVSALLGVHARPGRKVPCPFHADEHPSLHVYPGADRGWSCFSCGRGGSIYDLAGQLWGIGTRGREFVELRRVLHERFAGEISHAGMELGREVRARDRSRTRGL